VAGEFWMARWRSESEKNTVARDRWLSPWRGHRRSPDMHKGNYCDVVNHRGTWRTGAKWLTPTSLSEVVVIQAWYGGRSRIVTGVHPRRVISYPYELSATHDARITASGDQRWWTTGDEQRDRIFFSYPLLYHGTFSLWRLTVIV
jgi:hypothetical protein